MSWEKLLKNDFKEIDSFIQTMNELTSTAQVEFQKFETEKSVEMQQLATSIIDMGEAIIALEKMRNRQEELQ